MFFIKKFLPLLILPFGLGLLLIFIGFHTKKNIIFSIGLLILIIFSLGSVSEILWKLLEKPYSRKNINSIIYSDAIIVLSGTLHPAPGDSKIVEWQDPDRFLSGVKLFKNGKAPLIIFTGGLHPYYPYMPSEGEIFTQKAIAMGIPARSIKQTSIVSDTVQEAFEVRNLLNNALNKENKKIILVTSAFHMKRAKKTFERQGFEVQPYAVDFKAKGEWSGSFWRDPLMWLPNAKYLASSSAALREFIGRLIYNTW